VSVQLSAVSVRRRASKASAVASKSGVLDPLCTAAASAWTVASRSGVGVAVQLSAVTVQASKINAWAVALRSGVTVSVGVGVRVQLHAVTVSSSRICATAVASRFGDGTGVGVRTTAGRVLMLSRWASSVCRS